LFSNIPTVVTVSGGTPPYHLVSSNPAVLPVSSATSTTGNFLLIANNVPADTTVTITAVDANNQTVTGTYTVKSATVVNNLTVTPTAAGCSAGVCSGSDGVATVTLLSAAQAPLSGRQVRFDVPATSQGAYTFQTGIVGQPSVNTITVVTDQNGVARVR